MADQMKPANTVYNTLLETLNDRHWKYEQIPDKLAVHFYVGGDDIPMEFVFRVDPERQLVSMLSQMPFSFSEGKRLEGAIATCQTNFGLADGSFDYEYATGKIFFRMTSSFRSSLISKELLAYMIDCSCYTVDEYNDKYLMIDKGLLSLSDFLKK